jgi:hypothetical protein
LTIYRLCGIVDLQGDKNMKILKQYRDDPARLEAAGEPVGWFETTEEECIKRTEEQGYWKKGSVLSILAEGNQVHTPFAIYKADNGEVNLVD